MKSSINYSDFTKLDIRIGEVTAATAPPWSQKLLELTLDFGPEIGTRVIYSGVRQWYTPEDFVGKKFPCLINLTEKKMGEGVSQGMMLMADAVEGEETKPVLLPVEQSIPVGTVVR